MRQVGPNHTGTFLPGTGVVPPGRLGTNKEVTMTSESQEQGTDRVIARLEPACRLLAEARIHPWPEMQAMLPPLSRAQRAALEASIAADGVLQLVFVLPDGRIVDGANRWDIAPDQCRIEVVERSDEDALALGLALNLARRQLTAEQIAEVN